MPKKQKEEAEGDDLLGVPEDLLFVEHTVHAQDVITAYIEEVSEKLYQQNIKTREGPFAAKYVLRQILEVVQWNFVRHDPGETEATLAAEYDAVEDEPEPCAIDTWARGAIPSKVRVAVGAVPSGSRPTLLSPRHRWRRVRQEDR